MATTDSVAWPAVRSLLLSRWRLGCRQVHLLKIKLILQIVLEAAFAAVGFGLA